MPQPLNKLERRILTYLVDYLRRNTYQPSIREIGKRFGIKSTKTVSEHLQSLAEKGHIERDSSRSRGVKLLGLSLAPDVVQVPVHGIAGAGESGSFNGKVRERIGVDRDLVASEDAFVMEVHGSSMERAGIENGDMVFIQPLDQDAPEQGDIVGVSVNGEPMIKRWFQHDDALVLESANVEYPPLIVGDADQIEVLGRVTALFRRIPESQIPIRA